MDTVWTFLKSKSNELTVLAAIAALFISFLSIRFTALSLKMQRKHNRLSLSPYAYFAFGDYEDDVHVILHNYGVGPMIVTKFEAVKNGEIRSDLVSWMPELPNSLTWKDYHCNFVNLCIAQGGSVCVLRFSGDPGSRCYLEFRDKVRAALREVELSVHYNNVYGDTMERVSRSLEWFGRLLDV